MKINYGIGRYGLWYSIRSPRGGTTCQNRNPLRLLRAFVYSYRAHRRFERTGWWGKRP